MELVEKNYNLKIGYFLIIVFLLQLIPVFKNDGIVINIFYFLIIFLNIFPIYFYLVNYKKNNTIPLFYLTHLFFFLTYTLSIIYDQSSFTSSVGSDHDTLSAILTFEKQELIEASGNELLFTIKLYSLGLLFFNLGYLLICKYFKQNEINYNYFKIEENVNQVLIVGLISCIGYFLIIFFNENYILSKLNQSKNPLLFFYIGCFYIYIFKKKENFLIKSALIILCLIPIYKEILTGMMTKPFLIAFYLYLLNFLYSKKFYLGQIFLIILIFILLNTNKDFYRKVTLYNYPIPDNLTKNLQNKTYFERFIFTNKKAFKKIWKESYKSVIYKYSSTNLRRLFHSYNSLIIITELTPEKIPYFNGKSYIPLITKPIPRAVWPEKPKEEFGRYFGIVYEVLSPDDKQTSWNVPVLNEFYINYGQKGVIIGMFLIGCFFGIITRKLNFNKKNFLFLITFSSFYPIFYMESNLSLLIGAIPQKFFFLLILVFLLIFIQKKIIIKKNL
tara:strand:- start:18150 stop:19652 length:1503 start_codon:yes stop_codon:yes gene_type:complete